MNNKRRFAKDVMTDVATENGFTFSDLLLPSRKRKLSHTRFEAMYKAYVHCPHMSLPEIGRMLGGMDHTSVLHGLRRHCEMHDIDYQRVRRRAPIPYVASSVPINADDYRERVRVAA